MLNSSIETQSSAYPGFVSVSISFLEWANPPPNREGERVLWADGTAHNFPEFNSETVVVLRRK